jgi:hypothetical protein
MRAAEGDQGARPRRRERAQESSGFGVSSDLASMRVALCLAVLLAISCGSPAVERTGGTPHSDAASGGDGGPGFGFSVPDGAAAEAAAQSCAFQAFTAERLPLDLVLLVDASASMADPVAGAPRSKWQMVQDALFRFARDPASAGLGVGVQFFPVVGNGTPCSAPAECGFPDPGGASVCVGHRACVGQGGQASGAPGCDPFDPGLCPAGTSCQAVGLCAVTGVECGNVGGACPGGAAGDTCVAQPTTCAAAMPSCSADAYQKLAVPIADLPAAAPAVVRSLALRRPSGATPMAQAAQGALNHLRARLAAMPRRRAALIIATDGLPGGCGNQDIPTIADTLYTAKTTSPTVLTYVIGVLDPADVADAQSDFRQLAAAGGGGEPFILSPTSDLTGKLLDALARIRGQALACEYAIPEEKKGMIDFDRVNLHFTGGGADEDVAYVGRPDACGARGGWYYDVDPRQGATPSRLIACESTCQRFRGDGAGKVELRFGCKTVVIP